MNMDEGMIRELREMWSEALSAIETVLEERPGKHLEEISQAVCCLVQVRNRLIDVKRAQGLSPEASEHLCQINAMLSVVASLEYPLAGLRWQRVEMVRNGLSQMIESTSHVA